jgi:hypothetical protein
MSGPRVKTEEQLKSEFTTAEAAHKAYISSVPADGSTKFSRDTLEKYCIKAALLAVHYKNKNPSNLGLAEEYLKMAKSAGEEAQKFIRGLEPTVSHYARKLTELDEVATNRLNVLAEGLARYPDLVSKHQSGGVKVLGFFSKEHKKSDDRIRMENEVAAITVLQDEKVSPVERYTVLLRQAQIVLEKGQMDGKESGKSKALVDIIAKAERMDLDSKSPYVGPSKRKTPTDAAPEVKGEAKFAARRPSSSSS